MLKHSKIEEQENKSRIAHVIRKQDQALRKQHAFELNRKNVCTKCYCVRNTNGYCPMGCD